MPQTLFSIISPIYNCGPKIEKTITSVLSQKRELYEYIVVDGASTDDTLSYVENYRDHLRLISESDLGVYDAMNKGIDLASGKYLYFLGGGDCLRPHALEEIAGLMPDEELSLVYGNVYWVDQEFIYGGEFDKSRLRSYNICHQAAFYEKNIFDLIGKYELRYRVLADYVLNIKCFGNDEIRKKYIDYVIASVEGGGISSLEKDAALIEDHAQLIKDDLA
jgi:glycosyltransferase involved in cell wall biosynthesis